MGRTALSGGSAHSVFGVSLFDRAAEDRPAVGKHYVEVTSGEVNDDVTLRVRCRGDRDRTGAGGGRLTDSALPDARGDLARRIDLHDFDVRTAREGGMPDEQRPEPLHLGRVRPDDRMRIPDVDPPELDALH